MLLDLLTEARALGQKKLFVLIDPDKACRDTLRRLAGFAERGMVDCFLWGGSLVDQPQADYYLKLLKAHTSVPIVLFPGSVYQLNEEADGLLLLSLISGRNAELLIGRHVTVAARLKRMKLECVPTGYLLVDGGRPTSVSYMSGTVPLPADKPQLAVATALAGELLGLKLIYLDAGSGAENPVPKAMIGAVREGVDLPIVVGGGIRDIPAARGALTAGAGAIVVGNGLETDITWLPRLAEAVRSCSRPLPTPLSTETK